MADDFETMLAGNDLEKLSKELSSQINPQTRKDDDRFWYPANDQAGNGSAVIRFLPKPPGEDVPLVRVWSYRFKGPSGAWYSEKSLTTLGKKDPVGEFNSELWNTGDEGNRNQARDQKRKLTIYSNILVLADPANPENEGKVFLYRYGKKFWNLIDRAMNPPDPNDPEVQDQIKSMIHSILLQVQTFVSSSKPLVVFVTMTIRSFSRMNHYLMVTKRRSKKYGSKSMVYRSLLIYPSSSLMMN
jgi:hypothetical protein